MSTKINIMGSGLIECTLESRKDYDNWLLHILGKRRHGAVSWNKRSINPIMRDKKYVIYLPRDRTGDISDHTACPEVSQEKKQVLREYYYYSTTATAVPW